MRGEHVKRRGMGSRPRGSSPHARGAHPCGDGATFAVGIIPACAGSTIPRHLSHWHQGDHPRMRGEHSRSIITLLAAVGSSPHARGALPDELLQVAAPRIIPACTGSTPRGSTIGKRRRDHPRMRGEHLARVNPTCASKGSSPHARGAPGRRLGVLAVARIIPACAGSTSRRTPAQKA